MKSNVLKLTASFATIAIAVTAGALALADPSEEAKTSGEGALPPGWTSEDMQRMMAAATPGKMHEFLAKSEGTWHAATKMWMAPNADPVESEGSAKVSTLMDGRFVQIEMKGEMPGMGPYNGLGIAGYDKVSKEFNSIWIDNHGTGMMKGTGELSEDGKTLTWTYSFNCPVTQKPVKMREVETFTGPDTKTLDMYGAEPKSGEEFQMMHIDFKKK
jgi:hypothetical protein